MGILASRYDVVVAGGGSAGVAAAVGAARCGARTLLIERYGFLGGAVTNSNVPTYCGFFRQAVHPHRVVGGVGAEILRLLARAGNDVSPRRSSTGNWILTLDVEILKFALDELVTVPGLDVAMHALLVNATVHGGMVETVTLMDHSGPHEIAASAFVDATGEADLAVRAGMRPKLGRGSAGEQYPASFPLRIGGIKDPTALTPSALSAAVSRFRIDHPDMPLRDFGSIWCQLPVSNEMWCLAIDIPTNGADCWTQTEAERLGRRTAHAWIGALREQPGLEAAYIASTGPQVGVRESYHVDATLIVTGEAASRGERREDGIARAGWPMEIHSGPGRIAYRSVGGDGFFDIPYGAICARELRNLWLAGRNIGSDRDAYGSIRVMGTAFATGHAAGVAAAIDPSRVGPTLAIRATLEAQDALV